MALSSFSSKSVVAQLPILPPSQIPSFESFETQFDSAELELLLLEAEQQQQETNLLLLLQAERQQQETELLLQAEQQLSFYDNSYGDVECEFEDNLSNTFIDPYFNPNEFFYSNEYNFNSNFNYDEYNPSMTSLSPPQHNHPYPPQHLDPYPLQKRQKVAVDQIPNNSVDFCNTVYAPWNGGTRNVWLSEQNYVAAAAAAEGFQHGNAERKSVSPQSVTARERRRKIAEKTSDLGKLIPGGTKMNTAEMFQSAYKYIKYLQASISLLQTMHKIQENKIETSSMEALQVLLQSGTVQEKLSVEEKCLVPIHFVKVLADRHESELGSSVGHGLNQLVGSITI